MSPPADPSDLPRPELEAEVAALRGEVAEAEAAGGGATRRDGEHADRWGEGLLRRALYPARLSPLLSPVVATPGILMLSPADYPAGVTRSTVPVVMNTISPAGAPLAAR